jgi:hypothetical protein
MQMQRAVSKEAIQVAAILLKIGGAGASAAGTYVGRPIVGILAAQIDIAATLAREGRLPTLRAVLVQEGISVSSLSSDQRVKCGASLIGLAFSLPSFGGACLATTATEGFTSPWAYAEGMNALASLYAASEDCKPFVTKTIDNWASGMGNVDMDLKRWMIDRQQAGY